MISIRRYILKSMFKQKNAYIVHCENDAKTRAFKWSSNKTIQQINYINLLNTFDNCWIEATRNRATLIINRNRRFLKIFFWNDYWISIFVNNETDHVMKLMKKNNNMQKSNFAHRVLFSSRAFVVIRKQHRHVTKFVIK